jgi:hypothetical protein
MKLTINPIVEDFDETTDLTDELSGRVIYSLNEVVGKEISFYCGPETKEGYIHDSFDCGLYKQLEELLKDFNVSIGEAENLHSAFAKMDQDPKVLWEKVKQMLIDAGAVEMKSR